MTIRHFNLFAVLLAAGVLLLLALPARAATLIVTNLNDTGAGSLRDTVAAAGVNDTINFSVSGTITLSSGQLNILQNLIIDGGASITLDGNAFGTVVHVGAAATAELRGLTIINGNAGPNLGGGVANLGTLTILNSTISGNVSSGGGGVFNRGTLTIVNSTLSGNSTSSAVVGSVGGGGVLNGDIGTVTIINSTVSGNSADGNGGGILNDRGGMIILSGSTIANNTATGIGAGVYIRNGAASSTSTTYSNNTCGGAISDNGGNIATNSAGCPNSPASLPGVGVTAVVPAPPQCQEIVDAAFSAPVGWYCDVLMRNNVWVGYAGTVAGELVDSGVIIAVEVSYYDAPGHAVQEMTTQHQVCLQGEGRFIFLSASQSPRQIVEMNSVSEGGYTCAFIPNPGTVVLIEG